MIEKIWTRDMSREDWLKERKKSLGGSDMGAVLGLNKFRGPYAVWAEKIGKLPDQPDTEAMRIGRDLEPYVLRRFCEVSGKKTRHVNAILRNTDFPHMHANVDSVIDGEDSGVEAKTASALNEKNYAGGSFPESYYAQCVTYMAITGRIRWYLAVLVMGRQFKVYQMTRIPDDECPPWCESSVYVSDAEIQALAEAAKEFWVYVETKTAPPVDGLEATGDAIDAVHPESYSGQRVDLTPVQETVQQYLELRAELKERSELLKEMENKLKEYIGDAEGGDCDAAKISWKNQERRTFDAKRLQAAMPNIDLRPYYNVSKSRVFRIKEAS